MMKNLIEKLNDHKETIEVLRSTAKQGSYEFNLLGLHLLGFQKAIDIVKQHSDWISVDERLPTENDGRVSWGVNAYKKYVLVNMVSRGVVGACRFNLTDKCFETADKVTHWQPLPQLPSEVQDD